MLPSDVASRSRSSVKLSLLFAARALMMPRRIRSWMTLSSSFETFSAACSTRSGMRPLSFLFVFAKLFLAIFLNGNQDLWALASHMHQGSPDHYESEEDPQHGCDLK